MDTDQSSGPEASCGCQVLAGLVAEYWAWADWHLRVQTQTCHGMEDRTEAHGVTPNVSTDQIPDSIRD